MHGWRWDSLDGSLDRLLDECICLLCMPIYFLLQITPATPLLKSDTARLINNESEQQKSISETTRMLFDF